VRGAGAPCSALRRGRLSVGSIDYRSILYRIVNGFSERERPTLPAVCKRVPSATDIPAETVSESAEHVWEVKHIEGAALGGPLERCVGAYWSLERGLFWGVARVGARNVGLREGTVL
jgi:hypothetical protein